MVQKSWVVLLLLLVVNVTEAQEQPLIGNVSWIGNTFGGAKDKWVQNFVDGMFVTPDGTVFLNSGWDEGGGEASAYRDGEPVGRLGDNHGWGRFGGQTITADDSYVYVAMEQSGCDGGDDSLNMNGLNKYPPCNEQGKGPTWFSVRRYDRSTFIPVSFSEGYGQDGSQLIVDMADESTNHYQPIAGLAVYNDELFVAAPQSNLIKIYSTDTLELLREFAIDKPNEIAIDAIGDLWVLQREAQIDYGLSTDLTRIVRYSPDGIARPQQIIFEGISQPIALAFDNQGQLLVTDNGIRQQILIYGQLDTEPTLVSTFGVEGGIFSGVAGEIAPLKFYDLRGVGVDAEGNIYVGMGSGASGTHVQSWRNALGDERLIVCR